MLKKFTRLHLEIFDANRLKVFEKFKKYKRYGFLAGGTALALQLGHRVSYDFDIFCKKKITHGIIENCRKDFGVTQVLVNSSDEFTFLTKDDIKITFLYYPFVFSGKLVDPKIGPSLLGILDIASAKAYALNRRGVWRDYIDLYFIINTQLADLKRIISNAETIYDGLFSSKLFLGQLVYTKDIDAEDSKNVNLFGGSLSVKVVENFFKVKVLEFEKLL